MGLRWQNDDASTRAPVSFCGSEQNVSFRDAGECQASGIDRFPHSQSFTLIPVDTAHCILVNRLRGKFVIPAARYWLMPLYRCIAPRMMDHENRQIAAAIAAMQSKERGNASVSGR
jgi:hypothetical protein